MKKLFLMMALAMTTATASAQLQSGIKMSDLDTSVRPADDFYEYACGGWMKANPLPATSGPDEPVHEERMAGRGKPCIYHLSDW